MTGTESLAATEQPTVPECWTLLRSTPVGRLATVVMGQPDIHPVNHLVDHGTVLFRTAEGTKLRAAVGHEVAFEADATTPTPGGLRASSSRAPRGRSPSWTSPSA
jgi:uncharacterized protein